MILKEKIFLDSITLLQPTSPFRNAEDIQNAHKIFKKTGADSLVSVTKVPHNFNPEGIYSLKKDGELCQYIKQEKQLLRRQDKPEYWARNGPAILITTPVNIKNGELYGGKIVALPMPFLRSIDIDDQEDLTVAEAIWSII